MTPTQTRSDLARPDSAVASGSEPLQLSTAPKTGRRRIGVTGRVELGRELTLKQSHAPVETMAGGRQVKHLVGQKIDYRLARSSGDERAAIEDDGLVTGYGIFGAPGTGKTHLVLHILRQLLERVPADGDPRDRKFGGLILDPKAALLADVTEMWSELAPHRAGDLVVLKPDFLNALPPERGGSRDGSNAALSFEGIRIPPSHPRFLNVIDCALTPTELGRMLVLAAQSAGVAARDPFWFLAWTNLFAAALTLLEYKDAHVPTLKLLMDQIFQTLPAPRRASHGGHERPIQALAREAREYPASFIAKGARRHMSRRQVQADLFAASTQIDSFFQSDYVPTVEAFMTNAFGSFQQSKFWCLSRGSRRWTQKYSLAAGPPSLYDSVMEEGKVVLVSIGPQDPVMGKMLCTLVKCLFQQSVMSRLERCTAGTLRNFTRPVFIACDEYAEVASEIPGQPVGDGRFFSLSRQNGCLGLLATQSIHTLENSSLADSWKSIFSNLGAKIFMGAADNETAEQACTLAGQNDWEMTATTESYGKDATFSHQRSFQQRPELTPYVLTHVLKRGQAVAIGSLDGRHTPPALRFFEVPEHTTPPRRESWPR